MIVQILSLTIKKWVLAIARAAVSNTWAWKGTYWQTEIQDSVHFRNEPFLFSQIYIYSLQLGTNDKVTNIVLANNIWTPSSKSFLLYFPQPPGLVLSETFLLTLSHTFSFPQCLQLSILSSTSESEFVPNKGVVGHLNSGRA